MTKEEIAEIEERLRNTKRQGFVMKRENCEWCGERVFDPENKYCGDCLEWFEDAIEMAKEAL